MAGQEIATNPALRVKEPRVVSDLGKTVFLEDSPGSGVRCGLTVGKMKWGGRCWSSSGTIPGDATGKVGKQLWVPEAGEGGAGGRGGSEPVHSAGLVMEAGTLGQPRVEAGAWPLRGS